MFVGIFQRAAVSLLFLGKDPLEKTIPMFRQYPLNPVDVDQIAAEPDQRAAGRKSEAHENLTREDTENTELGQSQLFKIILVNRGM